MDCHLVYFWARLSMNSLFIAEFVWKLVDVLISFVIWHILMENKQNRLNCSWDIDEKVIFACKMPQLWKKINFREMAARPILWPTMPSNFMQNIRKIMDGFREMSKNPNFGLSSGLFLGTLKHEFLDNIRRCTYLFCYLTHFNAKSAKSVKRFLRYWRKGDFARKMPPLWKNQNFRKMAVRPILWLTMPSNFMRKIRKIK